MRRIAFISFAVAAAAALLPFTAGAASADTAVAAPDCYSAASKIMCDATAPISTVTWTVYFDGSASSFTASDELKLGCTSGTIYGLSFGYTYNGVTYGSGQTTVRCTSGPAE